MKIKLSKLRSLTIRKWNIESTFVDWSYWFIKIPLTKIVIHYEKLPF